MRAQLQERRMPPSIAFATCRALPEISADDELLAQALRASGFTVHGIPWDAPGTAWDGHAAVLLRSCWDYHERLPRFTEWLNATAAATLLLNAPDVVLPTLHKRYLLQAGAMDIAIPATVLLRRGECPSLAQLARGIDAHLAVVKPAVSASANETHRVDLRSPEAGALILRLLGRMDLLVQAFQPDIGNGELSLVYVEGRFSHAVRKRPAPGEWRVQATFGGTHALEAALAPALLDFGQASLLACAQRVPAYARVDVLETALGPLLMEVELIEPVLFLGSSEGAARRLADAIARRIALHAQGVQA
jgi:glutathione synthase/RimK-type ligase-like ATP-grasp enzyme